MLDVVAVVFAICLCKGYQDVACCYCCVFICWYLVYQDVGCCRWRVCYLLVFRLSCCLLLLLCLLSLSVQVIKMLIVVIVVFAICWCLGYQDVGCCYCCVCYLLVFRLSRCWLLLLLCLLSVGYPGSCIMLLVFSTQL